LVVRIQPILGIAAILTFCNWCVETDRLAANPLAKLCTADETCDRRRMRRALTEDEVHRLLTAARLRPVAERDRVVDIHALRNTFGTHLSKAGVAPRVAMAAMRYSSLDLTMSVYVDPVLLDVGAAVDALPAFSADTGSAKASMTS
jgi:integrase